VTTVQCACAGLREVTVAESRFREGHVERAPLGPALGASLIQVEIHRGHSVQRGVIPIEQKGLRQQHGPLRLRPQAIDRALARGLTGLLGHDLRENVSADGPHRRVGPVAEGDDPPARIGMPAHVGSESRVAATVMDEPADLTMIGDA